MGILRADRDGRVGVILALAVMGVGGSAVAAVTDYTSVSVNSPTQLYNFAVAPPGSPSSLTDYTGADVQLSYASTQNLGYGHYDGTTNITVKPTTDDTFAAASLATGQLKVRASIGFGTDVSGTPELPLTTNSGSTGAAAFADSFTAYSGNTPYLWTSGTQVTLHMAVNGTASIPNGFTSTDTHQYAYAVLQAYVYKKGTLDLIDQANKFDFNAYPDFPTALAAYNVLNAQITANTITTANWYLGTPVAYFANGDGVPVIDLSAPNPSIDFNFNPDGDFDFLLSETASIHLDASNQNTSVTLDLSHTIDTSYVGPDGATTFSASGLFPDTLPLADIPSTPEPAGAGVLLLGSVGMLVRRRRAKDGHA